MLFHKVKHSYVLWAISTQSIYPIGSCMCAPEDKWKNAHYTTKIVVNLSWEEWINELQCSHTVACCIVLQMNKIQLHASAWVS